MALKIFKKKNVPDELPSLDEKRKETKKEEKLAPDELSPIRSSIRFERKEERKEEEREDKKEAKAEEPEEDSELYFSKVMKKLNDENSEKSEEIIHPKSKDIINTLDSYWESKKNTNLLEDVERKINEKIVYLEELEEEWRHVKNEINDKEIVLGNKEMEIKENTEALKQLINEKAMLKSKLGKKSKLK